MSGSLICLWDKVNYKKEKVKVLSYTTGMKLESKELFFFLPEFHSSEP